MPLLEEDYEWPGWDIFRDQINGDMAKLNKDTDRKSHELAKNVLTLVKFFKYLQQKSDSIFIYFISDICNNKEKLQTYFTDSESIFIFIVLIHTHSFTNCSYMNSP